MKGKDGDYMIIQPERGTRNVNDLFYEAEKNRITMLNQEFFQDVELTKAENAVLVWLCIDLHFHITA